MMSQQSFQAQQRNIGNNDEDMRNPMSPQAEVPGGIVNRMKNSFESPRSGSPIQNGGNAGSFQYSANVEIRQNFEAESIEAEAKRLKEEACRQLECADQEFLRAQLAQEEAARAAELANQITMQALNKDVECAEKLVAAGHKLMEAGAKLQSEAAQIGQNRQATISIHQQGGIRQSTVVEAPAIPPPSELHVLQSRTVTQCIPVVEQQTFEKTYMQGPQTTF
jgi:hypothetical protein